MSTAGTKKIISFLGLSLSTVVASLIFTSLVFARSIDRTPVIATLTGLEHNIQSVAILADGRLQILDVGGQLKVTQLTPAALESLKSMVQDLAGVELEKVHNQIVCMMMRTPELSDLQVATYDWQKNIWGRELTLVLTQINCAVADKTFPKQQWAKERAESLRAAIKILALNELK